MQLNNKTAIALLVVTELCVEFIADAVENTLGHLPWMAWWRVAQSYYVPDFVICLTMIAIIITAIVMLEAQTIDNSVKAIWRKTRCYRAKRKRLKRKTVVKP